VAETVIVPALLPVKFAEHVAVAPLPLREQLVLVGDTPAPLAVRLTVPDGVVAVPLDVSVTLIVQLLATPVKTGLVQLTDVVVARLTEIDPLPELVACVPSPP
jgi:hypothetical protein